MLAYFSAVGWPAGAGAPTSPTHGDAPPPPMSPPTDARRAPAPQPQPQHPPQTMYWASPTSPPHARRQPPGTGRAPPPPPPSVPRGHGHAGMPYSAYPTHRTRSSSTMGHPHVPSLGEY
ncbi:hypothetical protein AMAG_20425 [Allomyces macrogynus ATCC 38327]|uniref:Uncharacterized protein n=1 Tax=Allomyces macrogynus (strain ATCC 38327) TaxID=578462 RepID=A0A0L0TB98_ALLM3|nr:hypothetical protein AMAG_20425 [Allomyces macrogynus ATCC 38327]|eukprot:KNE72022.1 hypothetical protein AMAG_20425 [Allomyces macrogynus ATCC 38327]